MKCNRSCGYYRMKLMTFIINYFQVSTRSIHDSILSVSNLNLACKNLPLLTYVSKLPVKTVR